MERWSLDATSCQQDLCCVCVTEPKDAALVPCGHKARIAGGSQSSIWVDCQKTFRCLYCWLFMLFMLLSSFASFSSLPLLCLFLQAMCYNCACQVQARGHWLMQLSISWNWKVRPSSRHSATCLGYVTVGSPMRRSLEFTLRDMAKEWNRKSSFLPISLVPLYLVLFPNLCLAQYLFCTLRS